MSATARVLPNGRVGLPLEIRQRHGLAKGGNVVVEDTEDGIIIRTVEQSIRRAQQLSRQLLAGRTASVDDFLAEKRREADSE